MNNQNFTSINISFENWKIYLLAAILLLNSPAEYAQPENEVEYRLKAVYLLNFLQFVDWPENVFDNEDSPIILSIIGDDPFGKILDETVEDEKISKHPVLIKRFRTLNELKFSHALFICSSEEEDYSTILNLVCESPVLTISDIGGFSNQGGDIEFYTEKNKIRFTINVQSLKKSNLKVSSKLLRLAKVINEI